MLRSIFLALLLVGCSPIVETRFVRPTLDRPNMPILPKVYGTELECLSKDAYQRLYDRQRLTVDHIKQLEAIIDEFNK